MDNKVHCFMNKRSSGNAGYELAVLQCCTWVEIGISGAGYLVNVNFRIRLPESLQLSDIFSQESST